MNKILVLDDDPTFVNGLVEGLRLRDFEALGEIHKENVLATIKSFRPDSIILDLAWHHPKDKTGIQILKSIREHWSKEDLPVFFLTANGSAIDFGPAIDAGANDFFTKPYDLDELVSIVNRTIEGKALGGAVHATSEWEEQIVGKSEKIINLIRELHQAAMTRQDVLFLGETGTGKTFIAKQYYKLFQKKYAARFEIININSLSQDLLAAEVFGTRKGGFTNAQDRESLIQRADGGVVFLDEIGAMSLESQRKLLQLIENKEITPVGGGGESVKVDVVILAATNDDLLDNVTKGTFKSDLYARLSKKIIQVPPLRDHLEDIPLLVDHFLTRYNYHQGKVIHTVDPEVVRYFQTLSWPLNIRQLQHCVEEGADKSIGGRIIMRDVLGFIEREKIVPAGVYAAGDSGINLELGHKQFKDEVLKRLEKEYLIHHLAKHDWNIQETALAIGYKQYQYVHELMKKYDIKKPGKRRLGAG